MHQCVERNTSVMSLIPAEPWLCWHTAKPKKPKEQGWVNKISHTRDVTVAHICNHVSVFVSISMVTSAFKHQDTPQRWCEEEWPAFPNSVTPTAFIWSVLETLALSYLNASLHIFHQLPPFLSLSSHTVPAHFTFLQLGTCVFFRYSERCYRKGKQYRGGHEGRGHYTTLPHC